MTEATLWQTDDRCPSCGELLRQRTHADGSITQDCDCGWEVTWYADPGGGDQ
jgi:hypothetical protein